MAASVASSWGPGFVVGVRRPVRFAGRPKAVRQVVRRAPVASPAPPVRQPVAEFTRVPAAPARSAPPARRRFEAGSPVQQPPVSPRARHVDRPAPSRVRPGRQVKRSRARTGAYRTAAPSRLHITRRGRLLVLLLVAVAVYAAFGLGRASAGGPPVPAHASTVVVGPGESIWSIAVKDYPKSDPRDVVGEIKSLNHLSSAELTVGQRLRLP